MMVEVTNFVSVADLSASDWLWWYPDEAFKLVFIQSAMLCW